MHHKHDSEVLKLVKKLSNASSSERKKILDETPYEILVKYHDELVEYKDKDEQIKDIKGRDVELEEDLRTQVAKKLGFVGQEVGHNFTAHNVNYHICLKTAKNQEQKNFFFNFQKSEFEKENIRIVFICGFKDQFFNIPGEWLKKYFEEFSKPPDEKGRFLVNICILDEGCFFGPKKDNRKIENFENFIP